MPPQDWPIDKHVGLFLINYWYERSQSTVGGATPGLQVVLGYVGNQAEQIKKSRAVSSVSVACARSEQRLCGLCAVPDSRFLPDFLS